jgi:acyl-CoA synthetase (AMP-forming)/AMP-acid ligase II/acyl carrier protein
VRIWNIYGPTEATANASVGRIDAGRRISIGRPIANASLAIVDRAFNSSPIGVPGELMIGGAGVARGYLNRPDLTAETFLPDSCSAMPGGRVYKTGDLARCLAEGDVEYLGRIDHQVKIRGFRVELGQIESVLADIPGVTQSAVVVSEDPRQERRLVAYVVQRDVGASDAVDIVGRLRDRLPPYMLPSMVIVLPDLPRLPSGKLDRRSLPEPAWEKAEAQTIQPATPTESLLLPIWIDVLKLARIGVLDSFFELGGHSLTATQLVSRVNDAFGTALSLSAVFEAPTIRLLAVEIERAQQHPGAAAIPPIARASRTLYQS